MPTILKADDAGLDPVRPFNFEDFRGRVATQLDAVRAESRDLVEKAVAEAADIRRKAEEEGRAAGLEQGLAEAAAQIEAESKRIADADVEVRLAAALPALAAAAAAVADARQAALDEQARDAVELALAVAAKLLGRDAGTLSEAALAAARDALAAASSAADCRLALNPRDLDAIAPQLDDAVAALAPLGEVAIVPDDAVPPGGCRLDGPHGHIDARLETRLGRLAEELLPNAAVADAASGR